MAHRGKRGSGTARWSSQEKLLDEVRNVRRDDLGNIDGVRLTFSVAESLGYGRVLFSASAEDPETDAIMGSASGVIETDGSVHWSELVDAQGGRFEGKIEGLSHHHRVVALVQFVIDDDEAGVPSVLSEAELSDGFL